MFPLTKETELLFHRKSESLYTSCWMWHVLWLPPDIFIFFPLSCCSRITGALLWHFELPLLCDGGIHEPTTVLFPRLFFFFLLFPHFSLSLSLSVLLYRFSSVPSLHSISPFTCLFSFPLSLSLFSPLFLCLSAFSTLFLPLPPPPHTHSFSTKGSSRWMSTRGFCVCLCVSAAGQWSSNGKGVQCCF